MGYYIYYEIEVKPFSLKDKLTKENSKLICEKVGGIFYTEYAMVRIREFINTLYIDETCSASCMIDTILNKDILFEAHSWYEYSDTIITLSKELPHLLFVVSGRDECDANLWKHCFHNGKMN